MGHFLPPSVASGRWGSICEDVSELIAGIWERNKNLPINPASCYLYLFPLQVKSDTQTIFSQMFSIHTDITYR